MVFPLTKSTYSHNFQLLDFRFVLVIYDQKFDFLPQKLKHHTEYKSEFHNYIEWEFVLKPSVASSSMKHIILLPLDRILSSWQVLHL